MNDWLKTFGAPDPNFSGSLRYSITSAQESLVVSILSAGTFFGALLGAPMADIVGRKWGIIASCLVFSVGVAMQTAATAMALFLVGRVFAGVGTSCSVIVIV
jgi:SP family sugar:H+ symporter-like MFS transporter